MLCDRCNINQASIHLENNINGTVKKADLCPACAQLLGLTANGALFENFFTHGALTNTQMQDNFFASAYKQSANQSQSGLEVCPSCGTYFIEFQKTALFGCPDCYEAFRPRLASLFKRVQAGPGHVGHKLAQVAYLAQTERPEHTEESSRTTKAEEVCPAEIATGEKSGEKAGTVKRTLESTIESLRQKQAKAVAAEDYELAAKIRDQIKQQEINHEQ